MKQLLAPGESTQVQAGPSPGALGTLVHSVGAKVWVANNAGGAQCPSLPTSTLLLNPLAVCSHGPEPLPRAPGP